MLSLVACGLYFTLYNIQHGANFRLFGKANWFIYIAHAVKPTLLEDPK